MRTHEINDVAHGGQAGNILNKDRRRSTDALIRFNEPDYINWIEAMPNSIPFSRPIDHTMFMALDRYVARKVPMAALTEALAYRRPVEIHGIYPAHLRCVMTDRGYTSIRAIKASRRNSKSWNVVRPEFFRALDPLGREVILVAVTPGVDYVYHYASLVRHFQHTMSVDAAEYLSVLRYPDAEQSICDWTGLDGSLVEEGDTVVLGYVDEISSLLHLPEIAHRRTDYYGVRRVRLADGRHLVLLGVAFSYWGSIGAKIVGRLADLGATEVIYVGKLGALTTPEDLYGRVFCPDQYFVLEHDRLRHEVKSNVRNGVLDLFPYLASGAHVSVPTVLEEDYTQRRLASDLGASSIDNEISQMAFSISQHNATAVTPVSFSAVHFATDYVRNVNESTLATAHDLARNRQGAALERKRAVIRRITSDILAPYFGLAVR